MPLAKVVRKIMFNTAGLDTGNSRWTDLSGRGNHLPHTAGTHSVSTVGSHDAWQPAVDSSEYSEFRPCRQAFTILLAFYHDSATNPVQYFITSGADSGTPYAADDHAAATEPSFDAQDDFQFKTNNTNAEVQGLSGGSVAKTVTKAQWNVLTFSYDPHTKTLKSQLNDGAVSTASLSYIQAALIIAHRARLGYFNSGGSIAGTAAYGLFEEIEGDAFAAQNTDLQAEISAQMTEFGVP